MKSEQIIKFFPLVCKHIPCYSEFMIAFIRGTLAQKSRENVVVDVQGVGYLIRVSKRHLMQLPPVNEEVQLATHLIHRDDQMELFGFESPEEREIFLSMTTVSGIGARTALAILSELTVSDIVTAIVSNQPKILASAPGIGKKTAERLILELREKLSKWRPQLPPDQQGKLKLDTLEEVEMTLLALGYTTEEIQKGLEVVLPSISGEQDADDVIRVILEKLS